MCVLRVLSPPFPTLPPSPFFPSPPPLPLSTPLPLYILSLPRLPSASLLPLLQPRPPCAHGLESNLPSAQPCSLAVGWAVWTELVWGLGEGPGEGCSQPPPMSLGLGGSLEAQLALETVIQVGPEGCGRPIQLLWKERVRSGCILRVPCGERCGAVHRDSSLQPPA